MFRVFRAQKGALMMIEPPGEVRMRGIFEVDDNVHIAVKEAVLKKLVGSVCQAGIVEFRARVEFALQEPSNKCC